MDFIIELIVEIIGEIFSVTYDLAGNAKSPKSMIWKFTSILIITVGAIFYFFLIIVLAVIIFTDLTAADIKLKIILFFIEILFICFTISMIRKIRKEIKTVKNKKTDIEKYVEEREKDSENIYYGGVYDKDRKKIILNGKEYKENNQ